MYGNKTLLAALAGTTLFARNEHWYFFFAQRRLAACWPRLSQSAETTAFFGLGAVIQSALHNIVYAATRLSNSTLSYLSPTEAVRWAVTFPQFFASFKK